MERVTEIDAMVTAMKIYLEVDKTDHFSHIEMQRLTPCTGMHSIYFLWKRAQYHDILS